MYRKFKKVVLSNALSFTIHIFFRTAVLRKLFDFNFSELYSQEYAVLHFAYKPLMCGTFYLDPSVPLKRIFAFSGGGWGGVFLAFQPMP